MNLEEKNDRIYKWAMLVMLAVTYFLMHGARQVFNASLPQIQTDLASHGATDAQLGLSRTFFLFAYGCMVPFAGIAADFFRRKWVIVIGTLLFSTSVFFTGFADSMLMFFIMYGFMNGIGQCMIPGAASSLIAQYHTETRSTALSIYQSALYVGILVSSVLAGYLGGASSSGWRISFWIFGGVAVVWIFVLTFFLRNTPALKVHDEEVKPKFSDAFKAFAAKPSAWLLTFAFGMLVFGSNCFRTWMPKFMQNAGWDLTPGAAAFHSVFWFYLGSFIGIAIGARTSDKLSHRRQGIRLSIMAIGLALSAPTMAGMVLVPSPVAQLRDDVHLRTRRRILRLQPLRGPLRRGGAALPLGGDGPLPQRCVLHRLSRHVGARQGGRALLAAGGHGDLRMHVRSRRARHLRCEDVFLQARPGGWLGER